MRLLPRMMFDDFFDDMFDEPLLHRNAVTAMRCDIREKDGSYLLDIELPGCKKEDIKMDLEDGYLTVSAVRDTRKEEKDDQGNIIRQERVQGSCSRSFYVGEAVTPEDIKAHYDNGCGNQENHYDRITRSLNQRISSSADFLYDPQKNAEAEVLYKNEDQSARVSHKL